MDVPRKRPSGSEADGRLPMSAADEAEDATEQAELRELLSSATVLSPDALARVRELMINSTRRHVTISTLAQHHAVPGLQRVHAPLRVSAERRNTS